MAHYRILVNLDCLLDVRLACVRQVNNDWVLPLVEKGYLNRNHNTLSLIYKEIDDQLILDQWNKRDIETLKLSNRTRLIDTLADYVNDESSENSNSPNQDTYKVTINTYPYQFEKEDLTELFQGLKFLLGVSSIGRIHLPNNELTITYLRERFEKFIIYDFDEWYNEDIQNELKEKPAKDLTCVRPFCYVKGQEHNTEEQECIKWVTAAFSQHLDIEFITLNEVSLFIPEHVAKATE